MSARIFHADLYGRRADKYQFLGENDLASTQWNEHPNTLKLNYYLARTYIAKDRFDEAQARLEKAYSLMERIMQPNDPHILKTLEALIELHQKTGDKEQAAKYKQLLKDAHG